MTTPHQHTKSPKSIIYNILLILGLAVILGGEGYFGYQLHSLSRQQEQLKEDYSMVNNITFGLFSVDQWREKLSDIVTSRINTFQVTKAQKRQMQEQVELKLSGMVDQIAKEFQKPQKSLMGKLKNFAFKQFVDLKEIKKVIPEFAKTIVDRVNSPASTKRLKNIATSQFDKLANQTYDSTEVAYAKVTQQMFTKYKVTNQLTFNNKIDSQLKTIRNTTYNYAYAMLACVVLGFSMWLVFRKRRHLHTSLFVMSLLFAFVLLVVGVTVSIIEVDARIDTLNFALMGEKVVFENQVLFYQSKSILGITKILIQQPKPDAITVGVLMLLFVIVLPILRMTARGIHLLAHKKIAESGVVRYLAFESGKWDMADVMVVGILMTYIGLNGILKSQLSGLNFKNDILTTTTINYTSLQPGYIIFVGYVAFGFALSYVLKRLDAHTHEEEDGDIVVK